LVPYCHSSNEQEATASLKYWETIADNFSKGGCSWGCVSALDANGRTTWIADAHCGHGKRFVLRADEKLTAFLELEAAIRVWRIGLTSRYDLRQAQGAKWI